MKQSRNWRGKRLLNLVRIKCLSQSMDNFRLISLMDGDRILEAVKATICTFDPWHSRIGKLCWDKLKIPLARIINNSVEERLPNPLKEAMAMPLLKKYYLSRGNVVSYIKEYSFLTRCFIYLFIFKVIEGVATEQLGCNSCPWPISIRCQSLFWDWCSIYCSGGWYLLTG